MSALLVFDTSTEQMSVGLCLDGRVWLRDAPGGPRASSELLPTIASLLSEAGTNLASLDAIGYGCGPGAFTGLRTACSVAQGLALGAAKPLLAIGTLMAVAEDARQGAEALQTWVAMDARMDQIYAAQYGYARGRWTQIDQPMLTDAMSLSVRWRAHPPAHVAGHALKAFAGRLHMAGALGHAEALPRAGALLRVAHQLWAQGETLDAAAALPTYLRDKVAQTIAERTLPPALAGGAS